MMEKDKKILEELNELGAKNLADWRGKSADFVPPDTYFETLIENAVQSNKGTNIAKKRSLRPYLQYAAAMLLVASIAGWWFFQNIDSSNQELAANINWQDVQEDDIQDYILANIDDFEIELLEELAMEETVDMDFFETDEIPAEDIEMYLGDEDWIEGEEDLF